MNHEMSPEAQSAIFRGGTAPDKDVPRKGVRFVPDRCEGERSGRKTNPGRRAPSPRPGEREPLRSLTKPSIAVLQFEHEWRPEQEYFVDGMVEEIHHRALEVQGCCVIARN